MINAGVMHTHELRPTDKTTRPGVHWKLFHAIYMTEGQKIVPRFYYCPMCHDMIYIKKGNGTNTLTRHPCFKVRLAKIKKEQETAKKFRPNVIKIEPRKPAAYNPATSNPAVRGSATVVRKPANEDMANIISKGQRSVLLQAFEQFGKTCSEHGALTTADLEVILPKKWTTSKW